MTHERSRPASERPDTTLSINPIFSREPLHPPRNALPEGEMDPETAYQIVHDELMLDGNARQNLATFVGTWAEPQSLRLMAECAQKNIIDKDEYPRTAELENRCVRMLAELWHAPTPARAPGCSTIGSSEAAMLAGLALKRRWQQRRRRAGQSTERPNLVMGINVQVCWEKFADYFEVEARRVPMRGDRFHLSGETAVELCDENTIGVVSVLGSTFDGSYEPVAEIAAALDAFEERTGIDVPIHVDGASGAMVAPFLDPELVWDFRLPRVASVNTSGHKYGLVMPGVGWVLWRDAEALPEDLVFHVDYLGGELPTFALSFSRPGAQVVAQYYTFLRLGFDGFRRVQRTCREVADRLTEELTELPFVSITRSPSIPVCAFATRPDVDRFGVFDVSAGLREFGWQVPAYHLPPDRTDLAILRVVVRNGFGHDLAGIFLDDVRRVVGRLRQQDRPRRSATDTAAFTHGARSSGHSGHRGGTSPSGAP